MNVSPRLTRFGFVSLMLATLLASAWTVAAQPTPDVAHPTVAAEVEHATQATAPHAEAAQSHAEASGEHHSTSPHPAWMLPFIIMLGFIALAPLINQHWWEHKYPYVAIALFAVGLIYYALIRGDMHPWFHEMREYVSFIALLFALFLVSGGIVIHVSRKATPTANVTLLLIGAVIANIFGTTGAAMLLIRPYIRINQHHIKPYHIIFFIFIVANVGGCLTPIGDPPLFLGYLKGVPFWWVIEYCWRPWMLGVAALLAIFFAIDKWDHRKEERHDWGEHDTGPAIRINGMLSILLTLVVIAGVFQASVFDAIGLVMKEGATPQNLLGVALSREIIMVTAALASYFFTKKGIHETNKFNFEPIREVAIIFLAIFSTMVPALEYLDANADHMPLETPGQFYFATGTLSSVLDNAPTYLTFLQTRMGEIDPAQVAQSRKIIDSMAAAYQANPERGLVVPPIESNDVLRAVQATVKYHAGHIRNNQVSDDELKIGFLVGVPRFNLFLIAISVGAVFFGAMTYIGNAPNFMVKSIAESSGIKMPSFLGYIFKYSLPILLPLYIVIWYLFMQV